MRRSTLVILSFLLAGCAQPGHRSSPGETPVGWSAAVILDVGEDVGVGGIAVGDFDRSTPGLEVAAFAGDGRVFICHRTGGGPGEWKSRLVYEGPGELIQGRAVPRPGGPDAIAAVGMVEGGESDTGGPGRALLLVAGEGGGMHRPTRLWTPDRCGHGVAAADLLPERPGIEVAAADFGGRVAICPAPGGEAEVIHTGADRAKALAAADLSDRGKGLEIVCAYASGEVVLIERTEKGYEGRAILRREAGAARLAVGDLDSGADGPEIVCGFDDGSVYRIGVKGGAWVGSRILGAPMKIRGVAIGELDPSRPGPEIAAAAKDGTVRIVIEGDPAGRTIFQDSHPLHDLAAADLVAEAAGDEMVTAGYGGKVFLIYR